MITQTKRSQDKIVNGMPHSLVKDYTVKAYKGNELKFEKTVENNCDRIAVINLGKAVKADKIVVEVQSTYGADKTSIFEIRIY